VDDLDTCADAIVEQGVNLQNQVEDAFELNTTITPVVKLKLPFTAQQTFEDPYRPGMLGYEFSTYPHERGGERNFFVFSVSIRDASVPRQKSQPVFQAQEWGRPPPQQQPPGPYFERRLLGIYFGVVPNTPLIFHGDRLNRNVDGLGSKIISI
jgi:hypothetical protein